MKTKKQGKKQLWRRFETGQCARAEQFCYWSGEVHAWLWLAPKKKVKKEDQRREEKKGNEMRREEGKEHERKGQRLLEQCEEGFKNGSKNKWSVSDSKNMIQDAESIAVDRSSHRNRSNRRRQFDFQNSKSNQRRAYEEMFRAAKIAMSRFSACKHRETL